MCQIPPENTLVTAQMFSSYYHRTTLSYGFVSGIGWQHGRKQYPQWVPCSEGGEMVGDEVDEAEDDFLNILIGLVQGFSAIFCLYNIW